LLVQHASAGLVLDANLLVLLLVGKTRRALVGSHKRLSEFSADDFDALEDIIKRFPVITTTPNVLTEVSNLCWGFVGDDLERYLATIINHVTIVTEEYVPSKDVISATAFAHMGLSDAVLAEIASRNLLVLTMDGRLYHFLLSLSLPTINFNHIRTDYWKDS
jgi:hypothetical protein